MGLILLEQKNLKDVYQDTFQNITSRISEPVRHPELLEAGRIISVSPAIARVEGLNQVGSEELVQFANGGYGMVFSMDETAVGVVLLCDHAGVNAGEEVWRTGRILDIPVGTDLLGRVIDPLGQCLDHGGSLFGAERMTIENPAPTIMDRLPVTEPLQTGIKVIDAMIPIGRGQRELIIGDRKTGKTSIAIDTIIHQRDENVVCIYCAIGQRSGSVAHVIDVLRRSKAMDYTVVVSAESNGPAGLTYIAPYAATSIAESFMKKGKDVLIVYDDLTQHARAYRELALLLRRPPGREAFPGDIFYIHAKLLERSTHVKKHLGGGSITALPIVETEAQNISAYIPTNLISITDGQIYLSPGLFALGILPAVDVGKSVSRVGGKAQRPAYRSIVGDLKLEFAQYEELETFVRFGARLDESSSHIIERGRRIQACLRQDEHDTLSVEEQLLLLSALKDGQFDPIPVDDVPSAEQMVCKAAIQIDRELSHRMRSTRLSDDDREAMLALSGQALKNFMLQHRIEGHNE